MVGFVPLTKRLKDDGERVFSNSAVKLPDLGLGMAMSAAWKVNERERL